MHNNPSAIEPSNKENSDYIRLNRYLAKCGLGSRRTCDELISAGRIYVNGCKVSKLGIKINTKTDKVCYMGKEIREVLHLQYYAYHKPRGVVVTRFDPEGRKTIYDLLQTKLHSPEYLRYVGRLDKDSEGLLLLTNDGVLIHSLTHPRFHIKKVYHVKTDTAISEHETIKIVKGVESDGQILRAATVRPLNISRYDDSGYWYEIVLFEGKKRQIRRILESIGKTLERLIRVQVGTVLLGQLGCGEIRKLTEKEISSLMNAGYKK